MRKQWEIFHVAQQEKCSQFSSSLRFLCSSSASCFSFFFFSFFASPWEIHDFFLKMIFLFCIFLGKKSVMSSSTMNESTSNSANPLTGKKHILYPNSPTKSQHRSSKQQHVIQPSNPHQYYSLRWNNYQS